MSKPTQEEIKTAIEQLKELKPKVRHHSVFGDDNWAAIQAQIWTLESSAQVNLSQLEDNIYNRWPSEDQSHERNAAFDAWAWLNGEEIEGELVEGWQGLVVD